MINTVSEYTFVDSLCPDSYTYEGARALFQLYEEFEYSTGEQIEFDPVAIRCEWDEYASVAECCAEYGDAINTLEDLQDHTSVVEFKHGILIKAF